MDDLQLIVTGDGSHSLLNTRLNETYHSHHGAIQESRHVFIEHGLEYFLQQFHPQEARILEVGFGTGLNAWLSLQIAAKYPAIKFFYNSLEAFPLPPDIWSKLNYADNLIDNNFFEMLHLAEWEKPVTLNSNFTVYKQRVTLQDIKLSGPYDVVFYDAFAPNKQPEMWEFGHLQKVTEKIDHRGVFVTYCAKGQVKRDLKSLGLTVQTLSGPPGKKEMVRALKTPSVLP